jgi:dTMP kinase
VPVLARGVGGRLIVLEGPDGVGKTTQAARLAERLRAECPDRSVVALREPGGTPLGDGLRRMLLDPAQEIAPEAETLLFLASRAQLVRDVIGPQLRSGALVVLDRFFLSTYAYQIGGHGLPEAAVRAANALAVHGAVPDRTLLFEYPAADALVRAEARVTGGGGKGDRMHGLGSAFHARVSAAFAMFAGADWQAGHPECGPIVVVDARGTPDAVAARVWDAVRDLI